LQARIAKGSFKGTWKGPNKSGTLTAKKRT
jgi:hypothetical protein